MIPVGSTVKRSSYALRSYYENYLSLGDYTRKNAAKAEYERKRDERATVLEHLSAGNGYRLLWPGGEGSCLYYMVELAD